MSWTGIKVANVDGREGVIRRDIEGFAHRSLRIDVGDTGDATEWVQLNAVGADSGATGWRWLADSGEWYPLGDHNGDVRAQDAQRPVDSAGA